MSEATAPRKKSGRDGCLRVLGIDPAAAGPTGYGVVESDGRCCRMLLHGAFKVAARLRKQGEGKALEEIHSRLCQLIEECVPDVVAVESIFSALNVRTALRLAEVRGVVLLAAAQHGLEVHSYAPREVKASITGHGHADKRQMQLMVRALLSMTVTPEPTDAADALAVALCHLQTEQAMRRFGLPQTKNLARSTARSVRAAGEGAIRDGYATQVGAPRILLSR
ncbi:MAG TPA: crossover junction endodeoxyribonuclease RuvC [Candidatus Angelobacter sp.]|nr:crossover junction endodeoxyribonuclease RuvC [Candidatus Angelobacter sp.]